MQFYTYNLSLRNKGSLSMKCRKSKEFCRQELNFICYIFVDNTDQFSKAIWQCRFSFSQNLILGKDLKIPALQCTCHVCRYYWLDPRLLHPTQSGTRPSEVSPCSRTFFFLKVRFSDPSVADMRIFYGSESPLYINFALTFKTWNFSWKPKKGLWW
jgi:hypothetical protein